MKNIFIIVFLALIILGCGKQDTKTEYVEAPLTADPESEDYKRLTGSFLDGPCLAGAVVTAKPLDDNFNQTIGHYIGETKNDFGEYDLPVEIPENYAEVFADASCHNEVTGGIMNQKRLSAIIDLNAGEANNITPLTTIRSPIARHLMSQGFGTGTQCLIEAERLILEYMNMPALTVRFTDMTLQGQVTADSVLVAANSGLLYNKMEASQIDFMQRIAQDIIAGTTVHRAEFITALQSLPLFEIKDNLERRYADLGHNLTVPPFWNIIDSDGDGIINQDDPDSFVSLLDSKPLVTYANGLSNTCTNNFGITSHRFFAMPAVFPAEIVYGDYLLFDVDGDYLSIRLRDDNGTPANAADDIPGAEIFNAERIPVNYFRGSFYDGASSEYSNLPTRMQVKITGNNIQPATEYYAVVYKNTGYNPSFTCQGGLNDFGFNIQSIDDAVWINGGQTHPIYTSKWQSRITILKDQP